MLADRILNTTAQAQCCHGYRDSFANVPEVDAEKIAHVTQINVSKLIIYSNNSLLLFNCSTLCDKRAANTNILKSKNTRNLQILTVTT